MYPFSSPPRGERGLTRKRDNIAQSDVIPKSDSIWGGENRSLSDDFGDETDSTFVPIT
jgi:hypothetical protein